MKPGPRGVGERIGDEELVRVVRELRTAGNSLRAIAAALNEKGWRTPKGRPWQSQQVHNVLRRTIRSPSTREGMEYYSPPEVLEAARQVLGHIDLDPASCETANALVRADRFFTRVDDGLTKEWRGRVWVNPPGRRAEVNSQRNWWAECVRQWKCGHVEAAIFLSFNLNLLGTSQSCVVPVQAFPFCVFAKRLLYVRPSGTRMAVPYYRSMVVLVSGDKGMIGRFVEVFGASGMVSMPTKMPRRGIRY